MIQAWWYDSLIQSAYVFGPAIRAATCGNAGLTATSQHRRDRAEPNSAFRLEGYAFPMASLPPPPAGVPGWASAPARGSGPSRWTARVALLVAFLACILGVIGWFRPVVPDPVAAPTYSDEEVAAATAKVCAAFELVDRALRKATNAEGGDDPALQQALAVNGRLALVAGAVNLRDSLDPAAPKKLADDVNAFAGVISEMAVRYLVGAGREDPDLVRLKASGDSRAADVLAVC